MGSIASGNLAALLSLRCRRGLLTWIHQQPGKVRLLKKMINNTVTPGPGAYRLSTDFGYTDLSAIYRGNTRTS